MAAFVQAGRFSIWLLVVIFNFSFLIGLQFRADDFQIPQQRQALFVVCNAKPQVMRRLLVLFFLTLHFNGVSQQNSSKSILIINNASFRDCPNKALRIESKFTFIDTCYNTKTNTLSIDKKASTIQTELYTKLYKFTFADWKQIEDKLNSITNCDMITPLTIIVKQGALIKKYHLSRISNCYPESIKEIMESLEKEFND